MNGWAGGISAQDARFSCEKLAGLAVVRAVYFITDLAKRRFDRCRRIEFDDSSVIHERDSVAVFGFVQVSRGDKHGHTFGNKPPKNCPEIAPRDRVHPVGWLVEK